MTRPTAGLAALVGVVLGLGVLVGVVWAFLTPTLTGTIVSAGEARLDDVNDSTEFAGTATLALLLLGLGVVITVVAWFGARPSRGPVGFLVVVVASAAGSAVAAVVGDRVAHLRFGDPTSAPVGAPIELAPALFDDGRWWSFWPTPWVLLICAPLAVALLYAVFALMSDSADLGVGDLPGPAEGVDASGASQVVESGQPT